MLKTKSGVAPIAEPYVVPRRKSNLACVGVPVESALAFQSIFVGVPILFIIVSAMRDLHRLFLKDYYYCEAL